ncbi:MAG: sulfotransferase [Anaerolineae bacterium]
MQATFEKFVRELDELCRRRAADYPARLEAYTALSNKITDLCHWLQSQRSLDWQPDPTIIKQADTLTPIFVCGHYKSGTTFIRDLLDSHPQLSVLPGDGRLFELMNNTKSLPATKRAQLLREFWLHKVVNPTGLPPFWMFGQDVTPYSNFLCYLDYWLKENEEPDARLITAVGKAYYSANPFRSPQVRHWVDKTPVQELHIDILLGFYPKARFIHVVRNPLASLAAIKTMTAKRGRRFYLINHLPTFRASLQQGLKNQNRLGESRYIIIRYEDTLANPHSLMHLLTQHFGLIDSDLTPTINGMLSTPNSAYEENRVRGKIQKQSLERWRTVLTSTEIAHVVDALHGEATAYGYNLEDLYQSNRLQRTSLRAIRSLSRLVQAAWHHLRH